MYNSWNSNTTFSHNPISNLTPFTSARTRYWHHEHHNCFLVCRLLVACNKGRVFFQIHSVLTWSASEGSRTLERSQAPDAACGHLLSLTEWPVTMVYEYTKPRMPIAAMYASPGPCYGLPSLVGRTVCYDDPHWLLDVKRNAIGRQRHDFFLPFCFVFLISPVFFFSVHVSFSI